MREQGPGNKIAPQGRGNKGYWVIWERMEGMRENKKEGKTLLTI